VIAPGKSPLLTMFPIICPVIPNALGTVALAKVTSEGSQPP
jgi:hypothetical protein